MASRFRHTWRVIRERRPRGRKVAQSRSLRTASWSGPQSHVTWSLIFLGLLIIERHLEKSHLQPACRLPEQHWTVVLGLVDAIPSTKAGFQRCLCKAVHCILTCRPSRLKRARTKLSPAASHNVGTSRLIQVPHDIPLEA